MVRYYQLSTWTAAVGGASSVGLIAVFVSMGTGVESADGDSTEITTVVVGVLDATAADDWLVASRCSGMGTGRLRADCFFCWNNCNLYYSQRTLYWIIIIAFGWFHLQTHTFSSNINLQLFLRILRKKSLNRLILKAFRSFFHVIIANSIKLYWHITEINWIFLDLVLISAMFFYVTQVLICPLINGLS